LLKMEIKPLKISPPKLEEREKKSLHIGRRVIPLLISGLILSYYFHKVEWRELGRATLSANLWLFFPARIIPLFIYLLVDSYLLQRLLIWFHKPIRYSEIVYPRASLYLLALVNVQLSNGGMFLYLMRKAQIKAEKLAGLVLFRFAWSVWSINLGLSLALLVVFILGLPFHSPLSLKLILFGVGLIWASLILCLGLVYYYKNYQPERAHRPLWAVFFQARARHYLEVAGYTLLLAVIGVLNNYFCALSFKIRIPLHELIVLLPLADLISALPIAFAGLGTTTFAWQNLFRPYATPEQFLSFTLALPVTTYLTRAVFALFALPRAGKEIQKALSPPQSG